MKSGKPFAVFDIDGTLIRWQLYHAVADALAKRSVFDPEAYRDIREARMLWKRRAHSESFKAYEERLVRGYEALLSRLSVRQFQTAANDVFDEYKDQVYTYTRDLIKSLRAQGYLLLAISGSQTEIVGKIADYYGFDDFVGTQYERVSGRFSGRRASAPKDKAEVLRMLVHKHEATFKGSLAVGDSEGDIPMLEIAEEAVAFNPSEKLFRHAARKGWKIVVERKNHVYELIQRDGTYVLA